MKRLLTAVAAGALLLPAVAAHASDQAPLARAVAAPPMALWPRAALRDGGRHYVMRGQRVRVAGTVRQSLVGQRATVTISRGKRATTVSAPIRKSGRRGRFLAAFSARRGGRYVVRARVTGDDGAAVARAVSVRSIVPRPRASGRDVRLLQRGLARLGYVTPRGGRLNAGTRRALLAFRKANGMARRASAGRRVLAKLFRGQGGFALRYPRAGKHVEFDWSRQVLVLARGGRAERIYHASSGAMVTPTVFGTYSFYRSQPGTNAKGMVHSNYFIRGYAIHGYTSVPTYPASHGCIRVPIPNALEISNWIDMGDRISVYR